MSYVSIVEVHKHVVIGLQRMHVRISTFSSSLVVLTADQAGIHIQVIQRNRAQLLEIKVQQMPPDS